MTAKKERARIAQVVEQRPRSIAMVGGRKDAGSRPAAGIEEVRVPTVKKSLCVEVSFLAEVMEYAVRDDRTFASLVIHATRQYMKRYPLVVKKAAGQAVEGEKHQGIV